MAELIGMAIGIPAGMLLFLIGISLYKHCGRHEPRKEKE